MTATIAPPTARRSVFDRALPALPSAAAKPDAPQAVAYLDAWLALLADDPARGGEFDRELDQYAGELRRTGALTEYQGAGFLLALFAYQRVGSPLVATLVAQVDRRAALRGVRHCRWRGDIPEHQYDSYRYDDALRRSQLPNKHDRERGL